MGYKRPFDDGEFQELPFKHARQLEFSDNFAPFSGAVSCYGVPRKTYLSDDEDGNGSCKSQWREALEKYGVTNNSKSVDNSCDTKAPFSFVTRSWREEDVDSGRGAYSPPAEDFKNDFPRRTFVPFKDVYSSLSERSSRKQVPLGPNHQASIPTWTGRMKCLDQTIENNVSEERLSGTSVIPMPDLNQSALEYDKVGLGRKDCSCLDRGTVRCVQQHVKEAREELKRTLGNENFVKLGCFDMGEEVARRWSEEEEQTFLNVVYSYPASLGMNFWNQLSAVFPYRSKRELVSYYFNVFMLRKRAAQNRSHILEIDSDDDEWHGNNGGSSDGILAEDDEDSIIDSLAYQHDHVGQKGDYSEEDDSDSDDDDDDEDGDVGHVVGDSSKDGGVDHIAESYMLESVDEGKFDTAVEHGEKISGCSRDEFDFQDDSCVSFEFQSNVHDAKVWDAKFPGDPMKGVDILPTWSMIEEIFDQGMGDYKMKGDDQNVP